MLIKCFFYDEGRDWAVTSFEILHLLHGRKTSTYD
jgi:hypothetical protein